MKSATPKFACPMCHPDLWDADLIEVPDAVFCPQHTGHALAAVFGAANVGLLRDADGFARVVANEQRSLAA